MKLPVADCASVLTPDFARSLICSITARTGLPVFDDDLIQEALLRGWKAFRRPLPVEHPAAFFKKIVRDTIYDHWRRKHSIKNVPSDFSQINRLICIPDVEHRLDRERKVERIRDALTLLPRKQRELFESFYLEGRSIDELSVTHNKSRSAVKTTLFRSRLRIQRLLRAQAD